MPAELLGKKLQDVYPSSAGTPLDLACRRAIAEHIVVTTQHCFASQAWHSVVVMPDSRGGICIRCASSTWIRIAIWMSMKLLSAKAVIGKTKSLGEPPMKPGVLLPPITALIF